MKRITVYLFGLLLLGFYACAPTTTIVDTSCPGYKSASFSRGDINHEGVGIMPVLGGDEKEQYRRPMGDALHNHLRNNFGSDMVIHPQDVIRVLNEHDLAEDYSTALRNYQHTGIISGELIQNVGQALEVEYLLYTRLLASREVDFVYSGNGYQRVDIDELYVQSQVWSTSLGDVVWEGRGGVAVNLAHTQPNIVDLSAQGLAHVVGNPRDQGPCETPQALFDSAQEAYTNTYLAAILGSSVFSLIMLLTI